MKKIFFFLFLLVTVSSVLAQDDVNGLMLKATTLMQQSNFDEAIKVLNHALEISPGNLDVLKEKTFCSYLARDYAAAIESGKTTIARPDADVQCYQLLGLAYKGIAKFAEADKMYKAALKKFPRSGLLYSEYGDLLASENNPEEAIKQWEQGIQTDPNHSSNYYFAARYYSAKNKLVWSLLYGEIFVNIESLTGRTTEIKSLLFDDYKRVFSDSGLVYNPKLNIPPIEKAVVNILSNLRGFVTGDITPELLTEIRTRFVLEWFYKYQARLPFPLFSHQEHLLQEGYFDAYNQWLFGIEADGNKFNIWVNSHKDEVSEYQRFQQNYIFKIPIAGSYYVH